MLPEITHFDQRAFVKGRTIFDAIRTIDDVIEHTMNRDISGILVAIDFEKAFESLNFSFLLRVLHVFNFGLSFIQWVTRVLYNKVSRCVMNNGFTSGPFSLSRGVRQGDPPSPYLFILALEILAIKIRNDNNFQGIRIGEKIVKLTALFADDMTCFIRDIKSYPILFETLRAFEAYSGLKVNKDKTEALALGNSGSLWEGHLVINNLCDIIKILGVYFGGDAKKREELNFWKTLESIKKTINLWKWRGLSLIGRIQIVKTFAIPKLMFRASAISISKDLVKEAESIFYHFIWNGKEIFLCQLSIGNVWLHGYIYRSFMAKKTNRTYR